jgi:hypothetical protein
MGRSCDFQSQKQGSSPCRSTKLCWSSGLGRLILNQEDTGSNPVHSTSVTREVRAKVGLPVSHIGVTCADGLPGALHN